MKKTALVKIAVLRLCAMTVWALYGICKAAAVIAGLLEASQAFADKASRVMWKHTKRAAAFTYWLTQSAVRDALFYARHMGGFRKQILLECRSQVTLP